MVLYDEALKKTKLAHAKTKKSIFEEFFAVENWAIQGPPSKCHSYLKLSLQTKKNEWMHGRFGYSICRPS
jgi:hypothetical protein